MMPIWDDDEGVYRCYECFWEVEDGYCHRCEITFDGIAPPDAAPPDVVPSDVAPSDVAPPNIATDGTHSPES